MRRLLCPASVALVGASANAQSLGGRALANLERFPGRLYLVNPNASEIRGRPCLADIASLPEPVDCVVLAIPAEGVEQVVRDCALAHAGAVVVFASGYAETGAAHGLAAQQRLVQLAESGAMLLVGPNCVGVANLELGLHAAFAEFPGSDLLPGCRVGLVSQSGALALSLSQAAQCGVSFSHVLTCGNSADVDVADFVAFLAQDSSCDAIALVFEGLASSQRLLEALRIAWSHGKRVALCKVGTSALGRCAVAHHTATEPLPDGVLREIAALSGVALVERIEALVETAAFLAKAPVASAPGVAVLSGSGGTGILAVDAAARAGVLTPQPTVATARRLPAALPPFASPRNPCDATAQATRNPQSLLDCAQALLEDPAYAALVIPWGRSQRAAMLTELGALGLRQRKPVCVVWMSPYVEADVQTLAERHPGLAAFRSLDHCLAALACWMRDAADIE